jgi:hypothetical protein
MLYYLKQRTDSAIWKVPPEGGAESAVLESASVLGFGRWQPFNDGIYFVQRLGKMSSSEDEVQFFSFATGKMNLIARLSKPMSGYGGLSVSADRRQAIFAQVDQSDHDIMLVEHFR